MSGNDILSTPDGQGSKSKIRYLPPELWRLIIEHFAKNGRLHDKNPDASTEPIDYCLHSHVQSEARTIPSQILPLTLVCRLWRDLGEEFLYRSLEAHDLATIEALKLCIQKPARMRLQAISRQDPRHRTRGIWTRTFMFTNHRDLSAQLWEGYNTRLNVAIRSLLKLLPNIQVFTVQTEPGMRMEVVPWLLQGLPPSVVEIQCIGVDIFVKECDIPGRLRHQLQALRWDTQHDQDNAYRLQLSQLRWLYIHSYTSGIQEWDCPLLSTLVISIDEPLTNVSLIRGIENIGETVKSLELHCHSYSQWYCLTPALVAQFPRLGTLALNPLHFLGQYGEEWDVKWQSVHRLILNVPHPTTNDDEELSMSPTITQVWEVVKTVLDWASISLPCLKDIVLLAPRSLYQNLVSDFPAVIKEMLPYEVKASVKTEHEGL
ncbi:hypothetical protein CPB86DRAFT_798558 [Serendipita vermifera]|nr:hypothetical protein CPB86DRAFT_798558 [Serendipita vermifera]